MLTNRFNRFQSVASSWVTGREPLPTDDDAQHSDEAERSGEDGPSLRADEEEGFEHGEGEEAMVVLGGCCCVICFVLFIVIMCSFKGVPATSIALKRNTVTGVIDTSTPFDSGRYFVGTWNDFILFPKNIQNIEWLDGRPMSVEGEMVQDLNPINVRTRSGQMVNLGIAVQYQINTATLGAMYSNYTTTIEQNFITKFKSMVADLISTHQTRALWTERIRVQTQMLNGCRTMVQTEMNGYISCWDLQLVGADIPDVVERQTIREQVVRQEQLLQEQIQVARTTRAETEVQVSSKDRDIRNVRSNAEAQAYARRTESRTDAESRWIQARASALGTIRERLTTGPDPMEGTQLENGEIVQYLEKVAILRAQNATMSYGDFSIAVVNAVR